MRITRRIENPDTELVQVYYDLAIADMEGEGIMEFEGYLDHEQGTVDFVLPFAPNDSGTEESIDDIIRDFQEDIYFSGQCIEFIKIMRHSSDIEVKKDMFWNDQDLLLRVTVPFSHPLIPKGDEPIDLWQANQDRILGLNKRG